MSKKTYLLILVLVVAATYLAFLAIYRPKKAPPPPPTQATLPVYQATLSLLPNPLVVSPTTITSNVSLDAVLDSVTQKATAVQLELSYDPKVISNVDVAPGTFFDNPTILLKNIDQVNGRISFAIGIAPTGTAKQGKGTVAKISFTANTRAAKASQITFLPKTLVTAEGVTTSVLKSSSGTTLLFQTAGAATPTATVTPLKTGTSSAQ